MKSQLNSYKYRRAPHLCTYTHTHMPHTGYVTSTDDEKLAVYAPSASTKTLRRNTPFRSVKQSDSPLHSIRWLTNRLILGGCGETGRTN